MGEGFPFVPGSRRAPIVDAVAIPGRRASNTLFDTDHKGQFRGWVRQNGKPFPRSGLNAGKRGNPGIPGVSEVGNRLDPVADFRGATLRWRACRPDVRLPHRGTGYAIQRISMRYETDC